MSAASLFSFPDSHSVSAGQTFVVELRLNTQAEEVNALVIAVGYAPEYLEVIDVTTGGSVFSLSPVPPQIDNRAGVVNWQAGAPGGFTGEGIVGSILFRARTPGETDIELGAASQVFKNTLPVSTAGLSLRGIRVVIRQSVVPSVVLTSKDYPDENRWYFGASPRVEWEVKPGSTYSYLVSRRADEVPDEVPDTPVGAIKLITSDEGVLYFHLRECTSGLCGPAVTRRFMKDSVPPEPFNVRLTRGDQNIFGGRSFISFTTTDVTSGVDHYEVLDGGETGTWQVATSPYLLLDQSDSPSVHVRAVDKAGNARETVLQVPVEMSGLGRAVRVGGMVAVVVEVLLLLGLKRRTKRTLGEGR